jgi:NAD dependent epimerase/dehydratase family enzyme
MADELLLGGQRVVPARAVAFGYTFRFPALDTALADLLGR